MIHPKHLGAALLHAAISHPDPHVRQAALGGLQAMGFVKNGQAVAPGGQSMPSAPPAAAPGPPQAQAQQAPPPAPGLGGL